jgi:hypothetical protein
VKQGDDLALMEVLDKYGPVSVSIDSSSPDFVSYEKGHFDDCNSENIGLKRLYHFYKKNY